MKLKINKKEFKKHLDNIQRGMVIYSPLYSLKGVLIDANESNLTLTTSDGFLSIKEVIKNNQGIYIEEPGKILAPGRIFKEIIEKMGDEIFVQVNNNKMIISSEGSKTEVNLFDVNDYPRISFESFGKNLVINAKKFKSMIRNVAFAAAIDDKITILNGVNIKAKDNKIIVSATNSFRLAQEFMYIDSTIDFDITIISKKIRDFLPSDIEEDVTISVDDTKIISKIGSTTISSRIIDGVYLPIDKLISNKHESKLTLDIKEIEKNIDRVTLVSGEGKKIIKLQANRESVIFESKKSEIGEARSLANNFKFEGEPIEIIFDYMFLKEAISKYRGNISISFNGAQKPFILRGESNKNLIQLILPHRSF